jgi:hypothetical protein
MSTFSAIAHNVIPHSIMVAASLSIIGMNMHGASDLFSRHWMKPASQLTEADCLMAAAIVIASEQAGHLPSEDTNAILDLIGESITKARSISDAMQSIAL